jgi:glycosyltransferase
VTVVYNNPMVGDALHSILSQRLDPGDELELVVIDGGSTDGTLEVIEGFRKRLGVLVSEPDKGIYDAMNKGLGRATGEIIGTLNADDLYQDDRVLATVLDAFRRGGQAQVVFGDLVYVKKDDTSSVVRFWKSKPYEGGAFERGWVPPHPTFFVRREVYQQQGLFDTDYRLAADYELMLRFLAKAQVASAYVPKVLVRMRLGGATNKSLRNIARANLECQRACWKNGLRVPPWFLVRKLLSRLPQFFMSAPDA